MATLPVTTTACELMTIRPRTVSPVDSLAEAARLMVEYDIGVLPVLDGRRIVGVVTDRDIVVSSLRHRTRLSRLLVREAMSEDVCVCRTDTPVEIAAGRMRAHQVRRLPVLDERSNVVGLLSLADLARHAAREGDPGLERRVASTLAAICAPVLVVPGA